MFENVASVSNSWFWNKSSLFPLVDAQNDVIYYYYFGLICSIILENNVIFMEQGSFDLSESVMIAFFCAILNVSECNIILE